jgi:hypothetical protein
MSIHKIIFYSIFLFTILLTSAGLSSDAMASELTDKEISYVPIGLDTLIPITVDTIWEYPCRKNLTASEERMWKEYLGQYKVQKGIIFDHNRVRIGVRFREKLFFIDTNLQMHNPDGKVLKLPSDIQRKKFISFVNKNLGSECDEKY